MIFVIQLIYSQKLQQSVKQMRTELETVKKNIIDYLKHLIRDAQQKKAKEYAFANLKENTAFWLRDFCQKVLPVKFQESQQDMVKRGSVYMQMFFNEATESIKACIFHSYSKMRIGNK